MPVPRKTTPDVCPAARLFHLVTLFLFVLTFISSLHAQTIDVRSFGAAGNGSTDDSAAIQKAIESSTDGSTIVFGPASSTFVISRRIDMKPNRTYTGGGTIRMSSSAAGGTGMFRLANGQADNVTISGLTFDASKVGAILLIGVDGSSASVKNLVIKGNNFKNSRANETWENAIYLSSGMINANITQNTFVNTGGVYVTDPNNSVISENKFDTITGNAISVIMYNNSSNLVIAKNTGRKLYRMALEVFGDGRMDNLSVTENTFSDWQKETQHDAFGFSLCMRGTGTRIASNVLTGNDIWYGIEVGAEAMIVEDNVITGFGSGIILQGQNNTLIQRNRLLAQNEYGILFANVNGGSPNSRVLNNYIENSRSAAIGATPNNYGNSEISGNQILRNVGFHSSDATAGSNFIGIKIDDGIRSPVRVKNNTITQTSVNPNPNFNFWAIGVFSKVPGSEYSGNIVESKSNSPFGTGLTIWYQGLLDGSTVSGSRFNNLQRVTSGNTSPSINKSNNSACKVTYNDSNIVTSTSCSGGPSVDTTAPVISSAGVSNISQTHATLSWITDEPADSQAEYGTSSSFGLMTPVDGNMVVNHQVVLTGLTQNTTYSYRLRSKDSSGNAGVSTTMTFKTSSDVPPPVMVDPPVSGKAKFYRGVNLGSTNGTAIDGQSWLSYNEAMNRGLTVQNASPWTAEYKFPLTPAPDAATKLMLQSGIWRPNPGPGKGFSLIQQIPNGTYLVYFWVVENYQSNIRNIDIRLEGASAAESVADIQLGSWKKYGPYQVAVSDGTLNMDIVQKSKGDPHMMGFAIYSLAQEISSSNSAAMETEKFYRGIDFSGGSTTIEGNKWLSHADAVNSGLTISNALTGGGNVTLNPAADSDVQSMLSSVLWRNNPANGQGFSLRQTIPNGSYNVYLWTLENYKDNYRDMTVRMEGSAVATNIGTMPLGSWKKYGPYTVRVTDGALDLEFLRASKGDPQIAGLAIFSLE